MHDTLIEADVLKALLSTNTKVCVFDCRFSLADTGAGKGLWQAGHIPNAYYAHLDDNLSSRVIANVTGRHPLPEKEEFVRWLAQHGVDQDTQVIAYDSAGGAIAARLWWLCRWIGHQSCAVLNGGYKTWEAIAATEIHQASPSKLGNIKAAASLVKNLRTQDILEHPNALLIDARERPRFLGEQEPIDPISGHIPNALSYPFPENTDADGKFKNVEILQSRYSPLNDASHDREIIMYCGSGVTAIHNILAMAVAGFETPTLYEDSWSGWILDSKRKVAVGESAND